VQTETLKITQSRLDGGRGTDFDVSRSRSLLNLTLSTISPLEAAIQKTIYRIAVLTGRQPTALTSELTVPNRCRRSCRVSRSAISGDSVAPPPDIRAAERSLAAATARIGIATADLFPAGYVHRGAWGFEANTFAGLGKNGADTWNFGPRITWAAFDLGRVHARIKAADARTEASLAFYERHGSGSVGETERPPWWTSDRSNQDDNSWRPLLKQVRRQPTSRINATKAGSRISERAGRRTHAA